MKISDIIKTKVIFSKMLNEKISDKSFEAVLRSTIMSGISDESWENVAKSICYHCPEMKKEFENKGITVDI